jgi:hypothetical protein
MLSNAKYQTSKRRAVCAALLLCFSFVLFTAPSATRGETAVQSQDPLREKLDYLKTKLETYLSHSVVPDETVDAGTLQFQAVNFETCKLSWKTSVEYGHNPELAIFRDAKLVSYASVNLASIDSRLTKIYTDKFMKQHNVPWSLVVQFNTRAGSPGVSRQTSLTKNGRVTGPLAEHSKTFEFYFNFQDQQVARDVAQAFADASAMCRARTSRPR